MNWTSLIQCCCTARSVRRILAAMREQMDAWGVKMPSVEALPLHFGLNDFSRVGET